MALNAFSLDSIPDNLPSSAILESMGGSPFIISHSLLDGRTSIITEREHFCASALNLGITTTTKSTAFGPAEMTYLELMPMDEPRKTDFRSEQMLEMGMYDLFSCDTPVFTAFMPPSLNVISRIKGEIEDRISKMDVRSTKSPAQLFNSRDSVHNDLYYNSDQRGLLLRMLENINESIISRGSSYKVSMLVGSDQNSQAIISYIKSRTTVLRQRKMSVKGINSLHGRLLEMDGIPMPYRTASKLLWISGRIRTARSLNTAIPRSSGQISVGSYINSFANETNNEVRIEKSTLNLGTIITGVPGTGKTIAARHLLLQLLRNEGCPVIIISPTSEWNSFGNESGVNTMDLSDRRIRINLFGCETGSVKKFYEDLAMLIASASNAGPYTNSIEKCLLAAFAKAYQSCTDPNPEEVYGQIEESIIEQHAKRTSTSVKYTKHGENIRAALENLRLILMMPQFAYSGGMSFRKLVREGAVFDMSNISNSMKPLFYAFLLNQVYCITDEFDINGDNELRAMVCIEEAHLIFNSDDDSAATTDLKQRIQNFRKRGIGLMLITHSVTDINPSIRRLCQIKLYFRQSPDIAKYASNDMAFREDDYARATAVFKSLGQRTCALSHIEVTNGEKTPAGSVFVKIPAHECVPELYRAAPGFKTKDTVINAVGNARERTFEMYYLGERVFKGQMLDSVTVPNLLQGKPYELRMLGDRKKDTELFRVIGGYENRITVSNTK